MDDRKRVAAGVELGLERRHAQLAVVRPDGCTGRNARHRDPRIDRLQRDLEFLALAPARNLQADELLCISRRADGELARARAQLVLAWQRSDRRAIHGEGRSHPARVEGHHSRQPLQRDDEALPGIPADHDWLAPLGKTFRFDLQLVLSGRHQVAAAESDVPGRAHEVDAVELRLRARRDFDGGRSEKIAQRGQHDRGGSPARGLCPVPRRRRAPGRHCARLVIHDRNRQAVLRIRGVRGHRLELRRQRDVRHAAMAHDDRRPIAFLFERDTDAVEQIRSHAGLRSDRESPAAERDAPANLAGLAAGNDHGRTRPAHGERQVGRPEPALAQRIMSQNSFNRLLRTGRSPPSARRPAAAQLAPPVPKPGPCPDDGISPGSSSTSRVEKMFHIADAIDRDLREPVQLEPQTHQRTRRGERWSWSPDAASRSRGLPAAAAVAMRLRLRAPLRVRLRCDLRQTSMRRCGSALGVLEPARPSRADSREGSRFHGLTPGCERLVPALGAFGGTCARFEQVEGRGALPLVERRDRTLRLARPARTPAPSPKTARLFVPPAAASANPRDIATKCVGAAAHASLSMPSAARNCSVDRERLAKALLGATRRPASSRGARSMTASASSKPCRRARAPPSRRMQPARSQERADASRARRSSRPRAPPGRAPRRPSGPAAIVFERGELQRRLVPGLGRRPLPSRPDVVLRRQVPPSHSANTGVAQRTPRARPAS